MAFMSFIVTLSQDLYLSSLHRMYNSVQAELPNKLSRPLKPTKHMELVK